MRKQVIYKWVCVLIASVLLVIGTCGGVTFGTANPSVSVVGKGLLSLQTHVALAAQTNTPSSSLDSPKQPYTGMTTVEEKPWGYLYTLENGDVVEVGDSSTTDFKAHVKTIRWNGVADFSLWLEGGTFTPTLTDTTVSFDFNDDIHVEIYPSPPCPRIPEGGIEYNITLNSKPAQNKVTFGIDWNNITWSKILPLGEEYDQVACEEEWGVDLAPFIITPTSIISDVTSEVLLTREEYEVNSYIGVAKTNWHNSSGDLGGGVTYSTVSRSYLHIHRGQMTDALGDTAWVEDIQLNEAKKEITFALPKTWLRNATYPVHQVCGTDPAYTEDMDNWDSSTYGSDATWSDYDLFTNHDVPKDAVAEIIMSNQEAGIEAMTGVRTDGSSHERRVDLHEAEGGGVTTCRMFVVCHGTTGLIETYSEDISDANLFYLVGYWENVGFTELNSTIPCTVGSWGITAGLGFASKVLHTAFQNTQDDTSNTIGVREVGSSLERKMLVHEPERGGNSYLDALVKTDAANKIETYSSNALANLRGFGYFGEELDFVELFTRYDITGYGWFTKDLSSDLDQDGRVTDWLLTHDDISNELLLGLRIEGSSLERSILEHEAEDNGGSTGELTGFGMSAESDETGKVELRTGDPAHDWFYLMGYFKPSAAVDISNTPSSKAFGVVSENSTNWSNGSEPTWPLVDGDAYFTVTNNSSGNVSIDYKATNFSGGDNWTLTSGSPGENTVRMSVFIEGDNSTDGNALTTSDQTLISNLDSSDNVDWEVKLETGTFTDPAEKTSTITLTGALL